MKRRILFWWRWWGRMLTLDNRYSDFEIMVEAKFREHDNRLFELETIYKERG